MRYGIISDIHSNLDALNTVIDKLGVIDKILCPGDIVGYGPDPEECCSLIRSLGCVTVIGNHDAAAVGSNDISRFNPHARDAMLWTRERLSSQSLSMLESLPSVSYRDEFVMVHGSLANPLKFPYIHYPSDARPCFEEMKDYTLCFIGHTHISEVYVQRIGSFGVDQLSYTKSGKLDLKPGFRYIVNCGSVGQPRDRNIDAACGIYDSEENTVEIIRVPYDIAAVQHRMREYGLPDFLVNRLEHGE